MRKSITASRGYKSRERRRETALRIATNALKNHSPKTLGYEDLQTQITRLERKLGR